MSDELWKCTARKEYPAKRVTEGKAYAYCTGVPKERNMPVVQV